METWTAVYILKVLMDVFDQLLCDTFQIPFGSIKRIMPFATQWKQDNNINTLSWLPKSPDININAIKNVWKVLKLRVQRQTNEIQNADDLQRVVRDIWSDLHVPLHFIWSFYSSLPRSLIRIFHVLLRLTSRSATLQTYLCCTTVQVKIPPFFALDVLHCSLHLSVVRCYES
jgi:hypothetical protein